MVLSINVYICAYMYMYIYTHTYVYENGCLFLEMVLSSAETSGKLTALLCVLKWFFFKALNVRFANVLISLKRR